VSSTASTLAHLEFVPMLKSFAALALVFSLTTIVQAEEELAVFGYTGQGTISPAGGDHEWQPFVSYSAPGDPPVGFLNNVTKSVLDVLQGTSPDLVGDLATAELLATNNVDNTVWFGFLVPNGGTGSFIAPTESTLLSTAFSVAPGVGPIDFAGFDLTRVEVMTTAYQFIATDSFEITLQFTVYGDRIVPEPGTLAMFSMLGIAAAYRRR
jgi:hypothetical protein